MEHNDFHWNSNSIKLMLDLYRNRKEKFRDSKCKKKNLWNEISSEMTINGYNVNGDIVDKKIRNMKQTYRAIKDNNKATGHGRRKWEYFNIFEKIFANDLCVNGADTISSLDDSLNACLQDVECIDVEYLISDGDENAHDDRSSHEGNHQSVRKRKASESKVRYEIKKKSNALEGARLIELREIKEGVQRSNEIQEERNVLLAKLIEIENKKLNK